MTKTFRPPPVFALRPLRQDDQLDLEALNARPEVGKRIGRIEMSSAHRWTCVRAIMVENAFAGTVGMVQSNTGDGRDVEVFCALHASFEHQGLATAACRRLLETESLPTPDAKILLCVASDNSSAEALAKRLGFANTARRRISGEFIWERPSGD